MRWLIDMSRLGSYKIYQCPNCTAQYRHPIWASISVHVPISANLNLDRVCVGCGFTNQLNEWVFVKDLELLTEEEKQAKVAQLMYSLGVGNKPKINLGERIANLFKIQVKKPPKEYELFADIVVKG